MATLMDELDDDEIEASLLWTDDEEGDAEVIDPLDEELLLSDPVKIGKPIEPLQKQFSVVVNVNDSNITEKLIMGKLELGENGSTITNNIQQQMDSGESLDTTITEADEVALDVTFNTRDGLDTSVCDKDDITESANVTIIESVITNELSECNEVTNNESTASSLDPELTIVEVADSSININDDSTSVPNSNSSLIKSKECGESSVIDSTALSVVDSTESSSTDTIIKTSADASILQNNCDNNTADVSNPEPSPNITNKEDQITQVLPSCKSTNALKNIKRVKSLSDEQRPVNKRIRSSSEPVVSSEDTKTNDESSLTKDNKSKSISPKMKAKVECSSAITPKDNKSGKKKSVVYFKFKNYSKNSSCNPYICSACNLKFKEDAKFESHLIASHAMALVINDFDIDIHQHYKQKREKIISQGKSMLPKLTIQEGLVDQALINDYSKNIKYVGSPKNPQFFCKICENLYSTKNLIVEHLKSSKHQLRKSS